MFIVMIMIVWLKMSSRADSHCVIVKHVIQYISQAYIKWAKWAVHEEKQKIPRNSREDQKQEKNNKKSITHINKNIPLWLRCSYAYCGEAYTLFLFKGSHAKKVVKHWCIFSFQCTFALSLFVFTIFYGSRLQIRCTRQPDIRHLFSAHLAHTAVDWLDEFWRLGCKLDLSSNSLEAIRTLCGELWNKCWSCWL